MSERVHAESVEAPGWCGCFSNRWPCAFADLVRERDRLEAENADLREAVASFVARLRALERGSDYERSVVHCWLKQDHPFARAHPEWMAIWDSLEVWRALATPMLRREGE